MLETLSNTYITEFVSAWDEATGWNYYYLRIPGDKYLNFKSALSNGSLSLEDFGEIVRTGPGRHPSDIDRARFEKELGLDHEFDEKILSLISALGLEEEVIV